MHLIDTHAHLYLENFAHDLNEVVVRATQNGIKKILLPNIDIKSVEQVKRCCSQYPSVFYPMTGLHPTSVKDNWEEELSGITSLLSPKICCAIGETGIDLYWDKKYCQQQQEAFIAQINIALEYKLPIVIHSRESTEIVLEILSDYEGKGLIGVLHCFPGNTKQAEQAIDMGFMIGIGGVITYKKSLMREIVAAIPMENIILETDSPYLPPVPHRGQRNESSYLTLIAEEIAKIKGVTKEEAAIATYANSISLFTKVVL